MIISLNWLKDYVSLEGLTSQEIAKELTSLGLEVEGIKETTLFDEKIVVGKVLAAQKHPNADTLRLCRVDVGSGTVLDIVCGAPNAREGIFVAVAQIGVVMPDGMKIKASKIRGEASQGMLCSKRELGLSEDHEGIIELEDHHSLGIPVRSFLQEVDSILELNVTPNRSDCLSYIGVARDLAAKLQRPLKKPISELPPAKENHKLNIQVENAEASARFCAVLVKNVKAVPSPSWLQKRMTSMGMRSINCIVDVTNYVMVEYGQPIHAYDRRIIAGDALKVSLGHNTEFKTLDDSTVQLKPEDILICDAEKIVGLAGIKGGQNSQIQDDTNEIILEVAHFSQTHIRKTSRRLGLSSEASYRFERGVDVEVIPEVLRRVTTLLMECLREQNACEPYLASSLVDCYVAPLPPRKIALRLPRVRTIIANPVCTLDKCIQHLKNLGFVFCDKTEERALFEVPSWRNDVHREIDLIEEIARLEGFDNIPYEMPRMAIAGLAEDPYIEFCNQVKRSLASLGLCEVMTFPFVGKDIYERLQVPAGHGLWPSVRLANALNEQEAFLQTSLVPGLLQSVGRNRNHGRKGVRLFEMARSYFSEEAKSWVAGGVEWQNFLRPSRLLSMRAKSESGRVIERDLIAGVLDQPFVPKEWNHEEITADFYHAKDLVASFLKTLGIAKVDFVLPDPQAVPFLHPHASAMIVFGKDRLGWVGELHPQAVNAMDLGTDTPILFELDVEAIFEVQQKQSYKIKEPIRFPAMTRDLALLVPKELSYAAFQACMKKFPKKNLTNFRLFDLYEGGQVGAGLKSFASSYTFQSAQRTLTDAEVDAELGSLVQYLSKQLGAVQR